MLTVEGNDTAAVDALCSPGSIAASLQRRVRYSSKKSKGKETLEDCGTATWWVSGSAQSTSHCRYMEGEFRLSKDLRSTSDIGCFSVSVSATQPPTPVPSCLLSFSFRSLVLCCSEPVHQGRPEHETPRYCPSGNSDDACKRPPSPVLCPASV